MVQVKIQSERGDVIPTKPVSKKIVYKIMNDLKDCKTENEIYDIIGEWASVLYREIAGIISWSKKTEKIKELYVVIGSYFGIIVPYPKEVGAKNCLHSTFHTHPQIGLLIENYDQDSIKTHLKAGHYIKHVIIVDRKYIIQISRLKKLLPEYWSIKSV